MKTDPKKGEVKNGDIKFLKDSQSFLCFKKSSFVSVCTYNLWCYLQHLYHRQTNDRIFLVYGFFNYCSS